MLPLKLTLSAFGPFADKQEIDFTSLGDNPLFLINGPTGAGKTSILDAICFALYGKTTGDEREGSQMRCDLADEALLTYVEFSFQLAGKRYRIYRVPEQPRLKKSGEGYTQQKSEAQLYCDDGAEEVLLVAAKVSQATAEIQTLTGLDVDQFRQVMVLPQGKFRELLMADSKAREKILSQLFQTHIYRRIEDRLKQQALGISGKVKDHQSRRLGVLQSAELEEDAELAQELEKLTPELEALTEQKQQQALVVEQAKKKLDLATSVAQDFALRANLEQEAQSLADQAEQIKLSEQRLVQAQSADKITPYFEAWQSREQELKAQTEKQANAQSQLAQAEQAYNQSQVEVAKLAELESEQAQKSAQLLEIENLVPKFAERERVRNSLAEQSNKLEQLRLSGTQANAALTQHQERLTELNNQLPELETQAVLLTQLQPQQLRLEEKFAVYNKLQRCKHEAEKIQTQLDGAAVSGQALKLELENAKHELQCLRLSWHQGQAAILAASLSQGEACPVCGSQSHPNPAHSESHIPTEQEIELAQQALDTAQKAYSDAREGYKVLKQALAQQQSLASDFTEELAQYSQYSSSQFEAELKLLSTELAKANSANERVQTCRQEVTQLNEQMRLAQTRLDKEREAYGQQQVEVEKYKTQLAALDADLPSQYQDSNALQRASAELNAGAEQLTLTINNIRANAQRAAEQVASTKASIEALTQGLTQIKQAFAESENQFNHALTDAGFADKEAYQQASLTSQQQDELKEKINNYQQQCVTNQAKLDQLKQKLEQQSMPNIEELAYSLEQAREASITSDNAWQRVHMRYELLKQITEQLVLMDKEAKVLEQEYSIIGTLSDVANGHTGNRVSLQRFVLSVLLDDVLLEASRRLQLMSKGRYRLLRKEDRAKGNKASGLELEVEDAYTSKVRPVATLSGGESFMAALSMALGLSDVVQAYAGGIKLDTLFIDEGFGSLDQDSLELAIRTLMDLQSSGRMIGVISHVSEMKEQITTRLDVIKGAHGSETRISLP